MVGLLEYIFRVFTCCGLCQKGDGTLYFSKHRVPPSLCFTDIFKLPLLILLMSLRVISPLGYFRLAAFCLQPIGSVFPRGGLGVAVCSTKCMLWQCAICVASWPGLCHRGTMWLLLKQSPPWAASGAPSTSLMRRLLQFSIKGSHP